MAIEMSQCLPFKTGAILDEDSSKVSSNMDYRLLKNYARSGRAQADATEPARAHATLTLELTGPPGLLAKRW